MRARTAAALTLAFLPLAGWTCALPDSAWKPGVQATGQEPLDLAPPRTSAGALTPADAAPRVLRSADSFAAAAADHRVELLLPWFEQTPAAVATTAAAVLEQGQNALDAMARQDPAQLSFRSVFVALDDAHYPVVSALNRFHLMKETQPDAALRGACNEAVQNIEQWLVSAGYRPDLYALCAAFEASYGRGEQPRLQGEDLRLMRETMLDYRRAGFALSPAVRGEVEGLQKRLSEVVNQFDLHISSAQKELFFTREELEGAPEAFFSLSKADAGRHRIRVHVTPDVLTVLENVHDESVRRAVSTARHDLAVAENGPVLAEILQTRQRIAALLGYADWADYQTEVKMAGTGARAQNFVEDFIAGLEPKFRAELEVLKAIKAAETGLERPRIEVWDYLYYQNLLMARQYGVNSAELRNFFPLERVMEGMFLVYEHLFGLRFHPVTPTRPWVGDLKLYVVEDASTLEPLGAFYLDLFPREGKYNHFAQFDVVGGKRLPDGRYRRPVAALVCNFTPGVPGEPALMTHEEVQTFFHEFGHCLHAVLTRAEHARFAGGAVPRDFVEAPSQMFENWAWDPEVLSIFAGHWKDPSRGLPIETLRALKQADLAMKAVWYRRQLGYALADLRLHRGGVEDPAVVANRAMADAFLPVPAGTHFVTYFGHLTGYDAGYYGYAWADSIAADLATAFAQAPDGLLDAEVGMRLRREIYEPGGSRPVEDSVRAFLGRPSDARAFLRSVGIGD
jgi:thimet oligopeptidase